MSEPNGYPQQQPQPYPPQPAYPQAVPAGYANQPYPPVQPYGPAYPNPADTGSMGWAVLGFFVPVAGLILWLVWKDQRPLDAAKAGKGALAACIVWAVLVILYIIFVFVIIGIGVAASSAG